MEAVLEYLDLIQWPAMGITVLAAWFVGSVRRGRRVAGFWLFLASNLLWTIWGIQAGAYALIFMQLCLALLNIRGWMKNADRWSRA